MGCAERLEVYEWLLGQNQSKARDGGKGLASSSGVVEALAMCLQSSPLEADTGNASVSLVCGTILCKCNWVIGAWEGWEETELGWPLLDTAQQGCAGGLALPCPSMEG